MAFLYPRLEKSEAILIAEELRGKILEPYDDHQDPIDFGKATTKATGGVPASAAHLQKLRARVYENLSTMDVGLSGNAWAEEYDRRLGKALWENLEMIPGDSGSPEVWNFLSLVVLPNTCNARYSITDEANLHRHIGEIRRVYLKNLWVRRRIYKTRLDVGISVFSDDLHFQITDRVVTRTTPGLCHAIVDTLSQMPVASRTFYRRLLREIQAVASYVPFALLPESENRKLVLDIANHVAEDLRVAPPNRHHPDPDPSSFEEFTPLYKKASLENDVPFETIGVIDSHALSGVESLQLNQSSKPSEVRRHFESFKASSERAHSSALAKREEDRLAAQEGASPATIEDSSVDSFPEVSSPLAKKSPTGTTDDIRLVNSFTLRTWRKIYTKLQFRDLLGDEALVIFDEFFELKKASDPVSSTLMMRCMATALERGIMKPEDFMLKIVK